MKLNFKRIASVLTGAFMLSSTVALAAAANFPAPFVVGDSAVNTAIVYGSLAAQTDISAAGKIAAQIAGTQLAESITSSTSSTTVEGESEPVEKANQALYLSEAMSSVKPTFDDDELPTILKEQELTDKAGNSITVTQKINVPNATIAYGDGDDDSDTAPTLFADFTSATGVASSKIYSMEVSFDPVNITKMQDKAITLFGKPYTFSGDMDDLTNLSISLVGKSDAVKITSGETKTVNGHTVSVDVEDASNAVVTVDGESEDVTESEDYKIAGVDVYVQNIFSQNYAGGNNYVNLYFGSEKMTLENGEPVVFGTTEVDGTSVAITSSGAKVTKITVTVTPASLEDEVETLPMGTSFTDPVFGGIKFSLVSATPDLTDDSREEIVIKATGEDKASLKFTNAEGNEFNEDFFQVATGAAGVGNVTLGADGNIVSTAAITNVTEDDYFITCDGEYSQIWQVTDINLGSSPKVSIKDLTAGSAADDLSLTGATVGSTATFDLAGGTSSTITVRNATAPVYQITVSGTCNYLITEQGAKIGLNDVDGVGATSRVNITEESAYNDDDYKLVDESTLGITPNMTISLTHEPGSSGRDMQVALTMSDSFTEGVGDDDDYYVTKYGTFVKFTGDTDKVFTAYYSKEAMALGFYIGEVSSTSGGDDGGVPPAGQALLATDAETTKYAGKNLIVVGGSCVNTVAATLLGSSTPLCGSAFTTASGIGPGEYLIKTFNHPDAAGKIATLVAGYEAAETTQAVDFLLVNKPSTAVGDAYKTGTKVTVSAG